MADNGRSRSSPARLSNRARKLAEALAERRGVAVRELPATELDRLVAAANAEERSQAQVLAKQRKGTVARPGRWQTRDRLRRGKSS